MGLPWKVHNVNIFSPDFFKISLICHFLKYLLQYQIWVLCNVCFQAAKMYTVLNDTYTSDFFQISCMHYIMDWFEPHPHHSLVSLSKNINPSLVLVQPRKTCSCITERLLMGRKESNQTNKRKLYGFCPMYDSKITAKNVHCNDILPWLLINLPNFIHIISDKLEYGLYLMDGYQDGLENGNSYHNFPWWAQKPISSKFHSYNLRQVGIWFMSDGLLPR